MAVLRTIQLEQFELRILDAPNDDILTLLSGTFLGTPGGLQYQLTQTPERINAYQSIYFVCLYRHSRLIGLLAVVPRDFQTKHETIPGYYIRYLAIAGPFQSKTEAGHERHRKIKEKLERTVKDQIIALFRDPSRLGLPGFEPGRPALFYAFVEPANIRSANLVEQANYQRVGTFYTLPFSRNRPKADERVMRCTPDLYPIIRSLLNQTWDGSNAWFSDFVLHNNQYFVMLEDGKPVAAVQAHPASYRMKNMPGMKGFLFLRFLNRLPYFRKIFNGLTFRFLAFEGLFCEAGNEDKIPVLLESCCALSCYHAGLMWLDEKTMLCTRLRQSDKMGLLAKLAGGEPVAIYTNFYNVPDTLRKELIGRPFYISAFDSI